MSTDYHSFIEDDPLTRTGREKFGLDYIYPIQRFVMANILDGVQQLVVLPTGSGKSLCFQLPACFLSGLTLVVVPLLALMKDQLRRLQEVNIPTACIHGEQSVDEKEKLFLELSAGKYRLLYTTPETLQAERNREHFKRLKTAHLVIDEAHCVAEWGETFRPSYLLLKDFLLSLPVKPIVTAFTATASDRVLEKIKQILFYDTTVSLVKGYADRPNLFYRVIPTLSKEKTLINLLTRYPAPILVFTRSRKRAEFWARLIDYRLPEREVYFYHAGLEKAEREKVENWFFTSGNGILVSTSAYGMGVDKADIRTVIHIDIPPSVEAYLQESGRGGRDRQPAHAFLVYTTDDELYYLKLQESISRERYKAMLNYALNRVDCRREYLLSLLGQKLEVCSGCDICTKEAVIQADYSASLLQFFRKNRRRYTKREILHILYGRHHYEVLRDELYQDRCFGLLKDWEREEIAEAFDNLQACGYIRITARGFWKGRVVPGTGSSPFPGNAAD